VIPRIVGSPYVLGGPNGRIRMFTGNLSLSDGARMISGRGSLAIRWLPSPSMDFSLDALALVGLGADPVDVRVRGSVDGAKAYVSGIGSMGTTGFLQTRLTRGSGHGLAVIRFHIANFPTYRGSAVAGPQGTARARMELAADGWGVLLDCREGSVQLGKALNKTGGYMITHVGELSRQDGSPFQATDGLSALEAFEYLLTFAGGGRTAPFMHVGYDGAGHAIWRTWEKPPVVTWARRLSWFDPSDPGCLQRAFPALLHRWKDPHQREVVRRVTYLHSEANRRGIEPSLIVAQAALELLAWQVLVVERATISRPAFDRLPAADMLRLLLTVSEIPLAIPPELASLRTYAKSKSATDGPEALTQLRNLWVHPPKRSFAPSSYELGDAWQLIQWYVDLAMLRWLGYQGTFTSRITHRVDAVPW
jgi:hypothetical protein